MRGQVKKLILINKIIDSHLRLIQRRLTYVVSSTKSALFSRPAFIERADFNFPKKVEVSHAAPIYFSSEWQIFFGEKIGETLILEAKK